MNCWEILEIGATSDEREIRRAYAKKLKTTRPDENPEGYQQLREAFDEALTIAPYYQKEEQEKSIRLSDFQESAPERPVDLVGEFVEQPQADIQPYEPENPYDESNYQFEQMAIQEPQELDYSAADFLLSEVYRISTTEGETELETQWRRFYLELSELPLEQTDYLGRLGICFKTFNLIIHLYGNNGQLISIGLMIINSHNTVILKGWLMYKKKFNLLIS